MQYVALLFSSNRRKKHHRHSTTQNAFPAEPNRRIFSAITAFMDSLADSITWTKSLLGVFSESKYAFRTSVFTLNFLTPFLMQAYLCNRMIFKANLVTWTHSKRNKYRVVQKNIKRSYLNEVLGQTWSSMEHQEDFFFWGQIMQVLFKKIIWIN